MRGGLYRKFWEGSCAPGKNKILNEAFEIGFLPVKVLKKIP